MAISRKNANSMWKPTKIKLFSRNTTKNFLKIFNVKCKDRIWTNQFNLPLLRYHYFLSGNNCTGNRRLNDDRLCQVYINATLPRQT